MLDVITRIIDDNFVFQQDTGTSCIQRSPTNAQQNSQLSPQLWFTTVHSLINSIDYEI